MDRKNSHGRVIRSSDIVGVDSRGRPLVKLDGTGAPTKYKPDLARNILDAIQKWPNVSHACVLNGINYVTLRNWLLKSKNGRPNDGWELDYEGRTARFHVHYDDCIDASVQRVEETFIARAIGYKETLNHQGRVQYQMDEDLLRLGFFGYEAYLRDENGKPIPETVDKQDPECMLAVLKHFRPDRWTTKVNMDVTHKGGVLVVGARKAPADLEAEYGGPREIPLIDFVEVSDDPAA